MKRKKQKTVSEWQQINQQIQAVHEQEAAAVGRRQSIWGRLAVCLILLAGAAVLSQSKQAAPTDWVVPVKEEEALVKPGVEVDVQKSAEEDTVGPALRQVYRAKKEEYAFTWDVTCYEALKDRWSKAWDDEGEPTSLEQVVAQHGKPSLLKHVDGWVYVTYTKTFVEDLLDMRRYDERVDLAFKEENGAWLLQDKSMVYLVSDEVKALVEAAPYRSTMVEGTNQKAWLKDLIAPLAVGQSGTGQGGARLEAALDLLGQPTGYGFWNRSDTLVVIYQDVDSVYLWFKRQENGAYLLEKWE